VASPNWTAIKAEYLKGGTSYRKLADKYGISSRTIERRAKSESWVSDCRQVVGRVSAELPHRIAQELLTDATEWTRESLRLAAQARALYAEWMNPGKTQSVVGFTKEGSEIVEVAFLNAPKDLKDYIAALAAADKMGRLSLGMKDGLQAAPSGNPLQNMVDAIQQSKRNAGRG
jgi:hypothetical protein